MEQHKYKIFVDTVEGGEVFEEYVGLFVKALAQEYYAERKLMITIQRIDNTGDYENG